MRFCEGPALVTAPLYLFGKMWVGDTPLYESVSKRLTID